MSEKLSQITEEATSVENTDRVYIVQGGTSKYIDGETLNSLYSGGGSFEYQTEITTNTTLDGTQKGLNKVYPVNSTSATQITITTGDYVENDVINIERRGQGTVEIVADTGVRIRGVRDIDNRYFINDANSMVALLCRGGEEFAVIGNLTRGYTGAVTTSSYGSLGEGGVDVDVAVVGTGFSENMIVTVSANATQSSAFTYNSSTSITLHLTAVGVETDTVTVTYDNGDVFVDTDAITIGAAAADYTTNLVASYNLNSDTTDYTTNHDGTNTGVTFATAKVGNGGVFGSGDKVEVTDSNDFSFTDGVDDTSFSISTWVNFNPTLNNSRFIVSKRDATNLEWGLFVLSGTTLTIRLYSQNANTNQLISSVNTSGNISASTWYHVAVTYDGTGIASGLKLYLDSVDVGTSSEQGTYAGMSNTTSNLFLGVQAPSSSELNGSLDEVHIWKNRVLTPSEISDIYTTENAGTSIL